jgi:hypothetical protein
LPAIWKGIPPYYEETFKQAIREKKNTLRLFVLIILGAGINLTGGFGLVLGSIGELAITNGQVLFQNTPLPIQVSILAISYFLIGTLYSVVASLAQRPKRIVNPLYVQAVTAALIPFFILYAVITFNSQADVLNAVLEAFLFFIVAIPIFSSAGVGQFLLVRYFVGLNGSREDTRLTTLTLHAKLAEVKKVLSTQEVSNGFHLTLQQDDKDGSITFRTDYGVKEQFFLRVVKSSENENETELATVAYRRGIEGIVPSKAEVLDDMRTEGLKRVFTRSGIAFSDGESRQALMSCYTQAMELTQTKLLSLKSVEPHVRYITGGILIMFAVMTGLWFFGVIELALYETFLIFAGLSLLFEFLPLFSRMARKDEG